MVSKKLQDKFYAALESLRDGKNDYILEALAAGAKATFEGMLTGEVSKDGTYIPSKDEVPRSASIGPDSCPRVLTKEDIQMLTHDPDTENEEDPEELNFDSNEAKRFPTYPGQFSEEEYPMVAEAVAKLGNTIMAMRTKENAALVEAIKAGCDTCFTFNYDGNGWTPDEENPQPSAPAEPAPQGKYQFVGANEDEGDGDTADGVYAHGELEDRLGYDILCFCGGTTLEQFQQDIVNGYHNDPNFGNGIPVTVKGINEPCSLYVWYTQFDNGFVLPRGVVVLNSDTDAVNYAKEVWTKKPQRF